MSRGRLAALLAVLALVAVAIVLGTRGPAAPASDALASVRAQAALASCPTGISPMLPRLTLACLGGGAAVALQGPPSGRPTLVNVYGSWCGPCQREMPLLTAFTRAAAGKVALVGVDTEDEERLALLFAHDVGQHWSAVVDDDGAVLRAYAAGPPVTLFVDPAGAVVHVKRGPFRDAAELRRLTAAYLKVTV